MDQALPEPVGHNKPFRRVAEHLMQGHEFVAPHQDRAAAGTGEHKGAADSLAGAALPGRGTGSVVPSNCTRAASLAVR